MLNVKTKKTIFHLFLYALLPSSIFWGLALLPFDSFTPGIEQAVKIDPFLNGNLPRAKAGTQEGDWMLEDAFPNISFENPVCMKPEPGSNRLFVGDKSGVIEVIDNNSATKSKKLFLDISDELFRSGESGMGEFAFHPDYRNGKNYIYVYYNWRPNSQPEVEPGADFSTGAICYYRVSRFTVLDSYNAVDPTSEQVLIQQFDRATNHNAGAMFFGDDGFLYITLGDEGSGNDNLRNSQKIDDRLFSGVLRIDVDENSSKSHPIDNQPKQTPYQPENWPKSQTKGYFIPNDNPWVNEDNALEEFYAIGLRNPYNATKDPVSGIVYLTDVGQGRREEINILQKGANYQWAYKEGFYDANFVSKPDDLIGKDTPPVFEYSHEDGNNCIIGGYIYRGSKYASLTGKYIFGDNGSGKIWYVDPDATTLNSTLLLDTDGSGYGGISSFATDNNGRLFVLTLDNDETQSGIYALTRSTINVNTPPKWLSETGAFKDLSNLTPEDGIVPYEPKIPFWSDGALKKRWMALPNNGTYNNAENEQIRFSTDDFWQFPNGTVFIKHFELPLTSGDNQSTQRLETRFMVKGEDGEYFGFTYKWLEDGSDAQLLEGRLEEDFTVENKQGQSITQTWTYPSREECLSCHTEAAGRVLGVNARQLDHEMTYSESGITSNQLLTMRHLGMFRRDPTDLEISEVNTLPSLSDTTIDIETRARAYLDVNCAYCHRPENNIRANFDARFKTSSDVQDIVNGEPVDNMGIEGAKIVTPGSLEQSLLYIRLNERFEGAMPPLGKDVIDQQGVDIIKEWILEVNKQPSDTPSKNAKVSVKVLLEAFLNQSDGSMQSNLHERALLPTSQPFSGPPFNYDGSEKVASSSSEFVDWVMVEVRDETDPSIIVDRKAGMLSNSGLILDVAHNDTLAFDELSEGNYFIAVHHKSHLPIMSSAPVLFDANTPILYDFSADEGSTSGVQQLKEMDTYFTMYGGDYDQNGIINNLDYNAWKLNAAAVDLYIPVDADGNGIVNNLDFNFWSSIKSKIAIEVLRR